MSARRLFFALTLALVSVGISRPALPEALRANWQTWVLCLSLGATLAALAAARTREAFLWAGLPVILAALYLQPQRVASDGVFYFAPLHSIVVDHDLDFENEYRVLGAREGYFVRTATGRLPNNFSIGPAIVWTPFYLVAHGLGVMGLFRPTGFGYPYFTAIATGTAFAGFLGVICVFRFVRKLFPDRIALASTLLIWFGTFHVWYMVFEPSMSHAMAMASVACYLLVVGDGAKTTKEFAIMGALGGLVALMRWQNVVFLPVALVVAFARHGRPSLRELAVGAACFLLVFSPQLLYWKALYGSFLLIPQGGGYIDWGDPELVPVLFSSRHGLLAWAPVLWLGVIGFPGAIRRAPALVGALAVATLIAWYVNASVYDWWAGASFGSRRFDAALPGFALGIAACLSFIVPRVRVRPLLTVCIGLVPLLVWNVMLMGVYFSGAIPPDGPASFRQAASDGLELFYPRVGYPPSWPAALVGQPPAGAYDLLGARASSNNVVIRMGDRDALHLGRGWSLAERGRDRTLRTVSARSAEIYVVLSEPSPYHLSFQGVPGGEAELSLNGASIGGIVLDAAGHAEIEVRPELVLAGANELVLRVEREPGLSLASIRFLRPG